MVTVHPLFVGYGTLEEWRQAVDRKRNVFVSLITKLGETSGLGLRDDLLVILAAQPEAGGEIVHYCSLPIGRLRYVGGDPFGNDHEQERNKANGAVQLVTEWMNEQKLHTLPGVVAFPSDIQLMRGGANFLEFDQQTMTYRRSVIIG